MSKFVSKVLYWVAGFLPCKIIWDGEHPYLERYYLFGLGKDGRLFRAYLHRFVASDPDRGVHDHPWKLAVSLVLTGGYFEERLQDGKVVTRRVRPLTLNVIRGSDFHRVVLPEGKNAWSLFCHTGWVKGWGFMRPEGAENVLQYQAHKTDTQIDPRQWHRTAHPGRKEANRQAA